MCCVPHTRGDAAVGPLGQGQIGEQSASARGRRASRVDYGFYRNVSNDPLSLVSLCARERPEPGRMLHDAANRSRFPPTSWSTIARATGSDAQAARSAFDGLLETYRPVLHSYLVRIRRIPTDLAEDLLHGFIADKILGGALIRKADRQRGRFRNLLLKALDNYVATQLGRRGKSPVAVGSSAELPDQAVSASQHAAFDEAWARQVVHASLLAMQEDCEKQTRPDIWEIFSGRIVRPAFEGMSPASYDELVRRHRIGSPRQAINLLVTAKRMFYRNLERQVGRYAGSKESISAEIGELRTILLGSGR
jgi:DNA-directed RNA polymerase specialized sigma24 family protein